jgi:hypothetical protein
MGNLVFGMEFALDGGEGAQKQIAGIGHDGSAAGLDAVVGLEVKEAGEEVVAGDGGLEFGESSDEFGGEVGGFVAFVPTAGMVETEVSGRVGDGHAASAEVAESSSYDRVARNIPNVNYLLISYSNGVR